MNPAGADPILAAVIRSSLDCLIVTDEAGRVVEFNPAAEATFGYPREVALGQSIADLIVPDRHQAAHAEGIARYLAGGEPRVIGRRIEVEARRADGSVFPAELAITEARVAEERFFTASLRDVSDHRAIEAALRASEARLSAFFHHVPASVYIKDAEGRYVVVNADVARRLGRSIEELVGKRAHEVATPEIAAHAEAIEREVARTGIPQIAEQSFVLAGGVVHALATRFPLPDDEGRMTHVGAVLVDVTTQKLTEMQMRESEARLAAFMDHAPVAMYLKEVDGRYVVVNRRMDEVVTSAAGAILGHTTAEVFNPVAARFIAEADRRVVETGAAEIREEHYEGADDFRDAFTTRFPVRDGEGRITHIGGVLIDITSQKAAEAELAQSREALHQAEKISALGSLLAGVSHELNNPLSAVIGQAAMLEEDALGTPFADRAERIRLAAARCARIVQVFLAMARQKEPKRAWVNANDVVRDALELTAYGLRTSGITVECELSDDLPLLWADADQLHQVVVNLLVNSQHALQGHDGPRRLSVRSFAASSSTIGIDVSDTGPGIAPDVAKRIFDPFFTTKPQGVGTGLGLSFSLGLVDAHGGRLRLIEREGPGATFRVELPTSHPERDAAPATVPPAQAPSGVKGSALVVDDEPEVAEALREMLMRDGYAVEVARDGEAARARLQRQDYDVIVSDIRMPGLDGPELFDWISRERPALRSRIGFVTGDTLGPLAGDFLKRSKVPYIEKPFSPASLRELVSRLKPPAAD
jgi:PAS domain S-box-containing protein